MPKLDPLIEAVLDRDEVQLRRLLKKRPPDSAKDTDGRTALINAAAMGSHSMLDALLRSGADANLQDHQGLASLHFAAMKHDVATARTLITFGARIDIRDSWGNSPLFRAVYQRSERRNEFIALLLRYGADPDAVNNYGSSPRVLSELAVDGEVDWRKLGDGDAC